MRARKSPRAHKRTIRARRSAEPARVVRRSTVKPAALPVSLPAQDWALEPWSVEWDRREELLALSCLAAYRKVM